MCDLDKKEVNAIAREHVMEIAATALASYLRHKVGGKNENRRMLIDDMMAYGFLRRTIEASKLSSISAISSGGF